MGGFDDFWDNIAQAHRVDGGAEPERPVLTPDPLESEPESDEEDRTDGIFSPQFVESTGVHIYMKTCRELGVVPVQQFISMLDHEVVSLKHRGVGAAGGKAIFECLRFNKHIQALDMEDNQLGLNVDVDSGSLDHVCAAIRENGVLTNLDLSYNNFAGRGCAALAEALESNSRIRELSLRGNNMGDLGARALEARLNESGKLAKIDVSDNGIGIAGGRALGALITRAKSLKQADFSWNAVGARGTLDIAEGLKSASIVRLNLAWNGLGDAGAAAMGGSIRENQVLQFLDVSSNRIELEGARSIADGLHENQTLRSLQLNGNPIGDKGVVLVIEAVGVQCSVRDLGVQDCSTFKSGDGIFDPKNPTGHYRLELSDAFDVERFEKLREADRADEASGIDNFINVKLDGTAVDLPLDPEGKPDIQKWTPPATGVLLFDYVATKRVPKEAKPQRDEVFQSFRKELANPALSEDTKLLMLRSAATTHYWSAAQVVQLVKLITYQRRVDAVVMLFKRIVDIEQFYSEVWSELRPSERSAVRIRLGILLARLLAEHEPEQVETTAVAFLTELDEPPPDAPGDDEEEVPPGEPPGEPPFEGEAAAGEAAEGGEPPIPEGAADQPPPAAEGGAADEGAAADGAQPPMA
jgi:Ran GTPase-activating protein (RanGAP) involved in mRNA processing and transport